MAADKLIPVKMKNEHMDLPEVQTFRCGSKPHETPLAEWIKVHSAERIASGTRVWLYRLQSDNGPLVGYGSLAKGYIDTTQGDGSKRRRKVLEIPELALHEDFWGQPKGIADSEEKFSRQIVRHLQQQAREAQVRGQNIERLLALYVHPDAAEAQQLYLGCGFVFAPGRFLPDFDTDIELLGMDFVWR
jgi:hypothetical protein